MCVSVCYSAVRWSECKLWRYWWRSSSLDLWYKVDRFIYNSSFNKINYYYESTFIWNLKDKRTIRAAEVILLVNYSIITCIQYNYCLSTSVLGVFCGFSINLPQTVEAVKGSCVFIPCTFDIDHKYEDSLTDTAKRLWYKDETIVFNSSKPNTRLFKGKIFGTATQKNCTTRFDNVNQNHNGSYTSDLKLMVNCNITTENLNTPKFKLSSQVSVILFLFLIVTQMFYYWSRRFIFINTPLLLDMIIYIIL